MTEQTTPEDDMINGILDILRHISEIIAQNNDYRVVLPKIVHVLAQSLHVDVCSVYTYDTKRDVLALAATYGLNDRAVGSVTLKPGEGLTGASFQKGEILNLANPEKHIDFRYFEATGEERYKSFLSVPLTVGGRCVGILVIQRAKAVRFAPAIVDLAKSISAQLANIILNASIINALAGSRSKPTPRYDHVGQVTLRGVSANVGIATGKARLFESRDIFEEIDHGVTDDIQAELALFQEAINATKAQTVELEKRAMAMISEADASIFYTHMLFLEDPSFIKAVTREITDNSHNIEFSVKLVFRQYERKFLGLSDPVFKERLVDMKDVFSRLVETCRILRDGSADDAKALAFEGENQIVIAHELMPSDLIRMPIDKVVGIVTEKGGVTAHLAVLARALNIPAIMGVKDLCAHIRENDDIILDGHADLTYVRPENHVKARFEEMIATVEVLESATDNTPPLTLDGHEITLRGNISLICETSLLKTYGAKGVGLYRSEFLFMIRDYPPSEEDQYRVYSRVFKEVGSELVNIRALDIGGDKPLPYIKMPSEDNPALGNRGTRFLLTRPDILKPHLKAVLRAGESGKLNILFPMVSCEREVLSIRQVLSEVEMELHAKEIPHAEGYKVGMMLEVPSAAFNLENLLIHLDFVSVGSNDLFQYMFAVDRGNEMVADRYQALTPVFLRLLADIGAKFVDWPEKTLSICGEMAGNPFAAPFLLGAGFHELSMVPRHIPAVKRVVQAFKLDECQALLREATAMRNPEAVMYLVKEAFRDKNLESNA